MSNNSQNEASVTPINLNTTENGLEYTYDEPDEFDENPSLCIPRVYKNITVPFIENIFQNKLCFGLIKKINIVPNNNDKNFKKVFIHFDFCAPSYCSMARKFYETHLEVFKSLH